jgi:hypothetical protein
MDQTTIAKLINVAPMPINKCATLTQIENEPFSYWIDCAYGNECAKIYIFEEGQIADFLEWYWINDIESFIFDMSNINDKLCWDYFAQYTDVFKDQYPKPDNYTQLISHPNLVEIIQSFVAINGHQHMIQHLILTQNKLRSINIKHIKQTYYKFACKVGTQIYKTK